MRIGLGYDLHRLVKGRPLYLGGAAVPFAKGLLGHSDGDVLIHAVIDAILGAAGEGDIGTLFPDTDPALRGIRSPVLLAAVMERLRKKGLRPVSVDIVVVAEAPRLGPHVAAIKQSLAPLLGLEAGEIGLKAKTNEGLGLIGGGRAIACWAVVLLEASPRSAKKRSAAIP
jgi:2-C-methyl-D-erythritol 2,4-cyclodiphosphate synthase